MNASNVCDMTDEGRLSTNIGNIVLVAKMYPSQVQFLAKYRDLSVTSHIKCIVACWPDKPWPIKCCLSRGMYLYQVKMMLHFLNDVNDVESPSKSIITS